MADKSAFVPVDAITNHKATDMDVDIDDELFGKKGPSAPAAAPVVTPTPPAPPAKFQYKKPSTYQKTYAKK